MVNIILVLVSELNDLVIFFQNELRPFHDSSLVEVWDNQEFVEWFSSLSLGMVRQEKLFSADKLNKISLPVTEPDQVLIELYGGSSWILFVAGHIVLTTDLVFYNLIRCLAWASVGWEEPLLLVEDIRSSCEGVQREASLWFSNRLSECQVSVDASLLDDMHLVDIQNQELMALNLFFVLVDER